VLRRLPPAARDILLAVVFTAATQVELLLVTDDVDGSRPLQHLAFAVMTGAIALRRTSPAGASIVCAAGMAFQTVLGHAPAAGGFLAMLLLLGSLGWHGSRRESVVGLVATAFGALLYDVLREDFVIGDAVVNTVIVLLAWGAARLVRVATDRRVAAEVAADRAARDATRAERTRIANDLHDSLAHALTLITLQAGSARERIADPAAAPVLTGIERTGRHALDDMHRYLSLLGDPETPQAPGIVDLTDLADRVRDGGLEVRLEADHLDVAPGVSTTVYRVVQEALTNVARHSDARSASVVVRQDGNALVASVTDNGTGVPTRSKGSGHGLAGMAKRVGAFGGTVAAGRIEQGWRVEARIPLNGASG
jgi:signal transduction histidine kinase